MREHEVHYCVDAIKAAPMNESPWRYLRGLFKGDQDALAHNPLVVAACIEEIRKDASCVQALSLLVDLLGAGFRPTPSDTELLHQPVSSPADLASNVCTHLENVDAMRARYWAWRRSLLPSTTPVSWLSVMVTYLWVLLWTGRWADHQIFQLQLQIVYTGYGGPAWQERERVLLLGHNMLIDFCWL